MPNNKLILYNNSLYYSSSLTQLATVATLPILTLVASKTFDISGSDRTITLPKAANQYTQVIFGISVTNSSASSGTITIANLVCMYRGSGSACMYYCASNKGIGFYQSNRGIEANVYTPLTTSNITYSTSSIYNGTMIMNVYAYWLPDGKLITYNNSIYNSSLNKILTEDEYYFMGLKLIASVTNTTSITLEKPIVQYPKLYVFLYTNGTYIKIGNSDDNIRAGYFGISNVVMAIIKPIYTDSGWAATPLFGDWNRMASSQYLGMSITEDATTISHTSSLNSTKISVYIEWLPDGKIIFNNNSMYINSVLTEVAKSSQLNSNAFELLYTSTDMSAIEAGVELDITYADVYMLYATFRVATSTTKNVLINASPRIAMLSQWSSYVYIGGSSFKGFGIRIADTYAVCFDMVSGSTNNITISNFTSTDKVKVQLSVPLDVTSLSCSVYYIPWFA